MRRERKESGMMERTREMTILIVEDETIIARDVQSKLMALGYKVPRLAASGEEAIAVAEELTPDLVLMDIVIKGNVDGIEAADRIYSHLHIPVVYLTAYADEKTLARAKVTEPFGYILKPFEERELHSTIEMALYRHKMARALKRSEEKYRTIIESIEDGYFEVDHQGNLEFFNESLCRIMGYSREEVKGINNRQYMDGENASKVYEVFNRVYRTGESMQAFDWEILRKSGERRFIEASVSPVWDSVDKPVGFRGVVRDITDRKRSEEALKQSYDKLHGTLEGTIQALASVVEIRDSYTSGHQRRVAQLVVAIAEEMGLSEERIQGLRMAAIVHDIGKINVPAEILSKPGRLTPTEFALIKTHPDAGYEILKEIDFPWPIADIVEQHHERIDGSGYSKGRRDDEILMEARILAVADVVEAIASHRPYRPSLGMDQALEEITLNRGVTYDADVVDVCVSLFRERAFTMT